MKFFLSSCVMVAFVVARGSSAADKVDFQREIRPILSNNCFTCHGFDEKERKGAKKLGGLRLDTEDGSRIDLGGYAAVVPGQPAKSELIKRVTTADPDDIMPPPKTGKILKTKETELLKAWIAQGAKYEKHWAYLKPKRPPVPKTKNAKWPRNGPDHFILARLEQEKLTPQPEADRFALIRRVSLDLTGLPPTIEEVDAFVADKSPDAYEKLVDHFLAKDAYGEHWARMWLDLARYADSAGYADDPARTIWMYRDWAIRAFNENKPFDQFTIEQIAGDLLPNSTDDQVIATAFHRNTMTNNEGGTTDEEWRNAAVVDRVGTTMAVWMGTSMACAQCHTHKYDPLTNKEYFQLFAFLNNTEDADRGDESPVLSVLSPEQKEKRQKLEADIAALEKKFQTRSPALDAAQATWEREMTAAPPTWTPLKPGKAESSGGTTLAIQPDASILASGKTPEKDTYTITVTTDLKSITAFRLEALADSSLPAKGSGRSGNGNFVLSEFKVKAGKSAKRFSDASAPHSQEGFSVAKAIDGKDGDSGWAISPQFGKDHSAVFALKSSIERDEPITLTFELVQNSQFAQHLLGKFRLSATGAPNPLGTFSLPEPVRSALAVPPDKRSATQKTAMADYYVRTVAPEFDADRNQLKSLKKELAEFKPNTVPVLRELKGKQRRTTKIQIRGNFLALADEVTEGVPAIFHPLPADAPKDRLALARWLVDENNPLTARVLANRLWEQIFGNGLVRTTEEFGMQGELPTHPELLDWLATELVAQKWDMKKFLKMLVTSAAYRQSSRVTPELVEKDPDNRLLSRGPRFRMTAETVRDQALAVSGLLSKKMYGPSVRPARPSFGLTAAFGGALDWQPSKGEDKYRRALYTEWRRTSPYPSMATFDAPNREVCTLRRVRTNTPLQALVTLNDPVYIECAQALARRVSVANGTNVDKTRFALRLCLARPPTDAEVKRLVQLYDETRTELTKDPKKAADLATNPLGPAPKGTDVIELAAWTTVANVLLNLDETMMKR